MPWFLLVSSFLAQLVLRVHSRENDQDGAGLSVKKSHGLRKWRV